MSSEDIQKGGRWAQEIGNHLAESDFGVICLTPENQTSPWLLFEAGALSKSMARSSVGTVLLDMSTADLSGPLAQFQDTKLEETDFLRLVGTMNALLPSPLVQSKLEEAFALWWPKLAAKVEAARSLPAEVPAPRPERDILEELVQRLRAQDRAVGADIPTSPFGVPQWFEDYLRASKTPAVPRSAGVGLTMSERSVRAFENLFSYLTCPVHDSAFTYDLRPPKNGIAGAMVHSCCSFGARLANEHLRDIALP
jgi:hypothetical protein